MRGSNAPLTLDGGHLEGGGALVRTALAMSALTMQPVKVTDVRGNAPIPGITAEDLPIARALSLACGAQSSGEIGEHELLFSPGRRPVGLNEKIEPSEGNDDHHANALVVLQTLVPLMARSGVFSKLTVFGETYGHHVLSYDYYAAVTMGAHRRFGLYAYPELGMAGFGRGSWGEVRLEIEPSALQGVNWSKRGELLSCAAVVSIGELSPQVAGRGLSHLERLAQNASLPLSVDVNSVRSRFPGAFVTVFAEFENGLGGATAMGRRGMRMEAVAQSAFDGFLEWYKGDWTVDPFLPDQILITAAMAETDSVFTVQRITQRLLTIVWVIKQFLPIRITVLGKEGEPGTVTVRK